MIVNGEPINLMPIQQVVRWRDKYKGYYEQEKAAERIANGLGHKGNIYTRFSG